MKTVIIKVILRCLLVMVIGYLLGSVSLSYFIGKLTKNIDIRTKGSGNLGSTNVLRVLGKRAAIFTFIYDVLKGVISVWIADLLFKGEYEQYGSIGTMVSGIAVVLGHNFPFYLNFKGGKGIATSFGVALYLNPFGALTILAVEFIIIFASGYVSLASIINCVLYPFAVNLLWSAGSGDLYIWIMSVILAVFALIRHMPNIKRLIQGNENRFSLKKKKE